MYHIVRTFIIVSLILFAVPAGAQNFKRSQAFRSGEELSCNFYFNWKFIWVKVGSATLTIKDTIYNGEKAQCMKLLSSTNKKADSFFFMRDTLLTIFGADFKPLYYRKASREGKKFRINQVWYDYSNPAKTKVSQYYRRNDNEPRYKEEYVTGRVYDMMSLLAYARTIDFTALPEDTRLTFPVATGKAIEPQHLVYRGKKKTKSDDGHDYNCFRVSLITEEDGKEEEIVNFHITDDKNHLPILLDLVLNFGSAKARLSHKLGLLYPVSSIAD